jgi:competence protein ComEC
MLLLLCCLTLRRSPGLAGWLWLIPLFMLLGTVLVAWAEPGGGVLARGAREGKSAKVTGRVLDIPSSYGASIGFFLQTSSAKVGKDSWSTGERAYVRALGSTASSRVFPGMNVRISGRLTLPGEEDARIVDSGASCVITCSASSVKPSGQPTDPVSRLVAWMRAHLTGAFSRLFDGNTAGLMEGVTMSKLDHLRPETLADLRACGLSHIVSVAGLHVGSVAFLALALFTAVGASRRARYAAACFGALLVLLLADFRISALRAAMMSAACFGGAVWGRRYDPVVALSVAGIAILCTNPLAVFDPSFQYSFAAVLGIVLVVRRSTGKRTSRARTAIAVCAGAQLGILPIALISGGTVPMAALAANLLVVWVLGVLIVTGLSAAALSFVSLPLARVPALPVAAACRYIFGVAGWCSRVPSAGTFMGLASFLALALYAASLVMFARDNSGLFKPTVALFASLLLVLCSCYPVLVVSSDTTMRVLDVGEGDATLIRDSSGGVVLVDGGPDRQLVLNKLRAQGVSRIDLMVMSHPHSDHISGLVEVLAKLTVGRLLEPGLDHSAAGAYRDVMEEAVARGVPVTTAREGQVLTVTPHLKLEVLYAPKSLPSLPDNLNDCSVVVMASVDRNSILLSGDIESEAQRMLVKQHPSLRCDVVKVAHQGAANATTEELLDATEPAIATISVGKANKFGHPSPSCLALLREHGIRVSRTDLTGDILIRFSNGRIGLETGGDNAQKTRPDN